MQLKDLSISIKRLLVMLAPLSFLVGCATSYDVVYDSDPSGAYIICQNNVYGRAPLSVSYKFTEENVKAKMLHVQPCIVQWKSGAKSKTDQNIPMYLVNDSPEFDKYARLLGISKGTTHIVRRPDVPGREIDEEFAYRLAYEKKMQRQEAINGFLSALNGVVQQQREHTAAMTNLYTAYTPPPVVYIQNAVASPSVYHVQKVSDQVMHLRQVR